MAELNDRLPTAMEALSFSLTQLGVADKLQDYLAAKNALSSSLLRAGMQGNVLGMFPSFHTAEAMAQASNNVHAVGIGRKWADGKPTNTLCIRIYVIQKLPKSMLAPVQLLQTSIAGIETDVIEAPPAFAMAKKKAVKKAAPKKAAKKKMVKGAAAAGAALAFGAGAAGGGGGGGGGGCSANKRLAQRNPLIAGISAGHFNTTGTLGCFVRSREAGETDGVYVLSNNHVFANRNGASPGDNLMQPGLLDGGNPTDHHIAEFVRCQDLLFGGTDTNQVDAAIGRLVDGIDFENRNQICSIGEIPGVVAATDDMRVRKHGRTTGLTEGTITDLAVDAIVGMDPNDPSLVAKFINQIRIEPSAPYTSFAEPGDSGSLIVRVPDNSAVGLHFAGPKNGSYGLANHISEVLTALKIDLL